MSAHRSSVLDSLPPEAGTALRVCYGQNSDSIRFNEVINSKPKALHPPAPHAVSVRSFDQRIGSQLADNGINLIKKFCPQTRTSSIVPTG